MADVSSNLYKLKSFLDDNELLEAPNSHTDRITDLQGVTVFYPAFDRFCAFKGYLASYITWLIMGCGLSKYKDNTLIIEHWNACAPTTAASAL